MIPLLLAFTCVAVDGPKLLARHLATALPSFAQIPAEVELGYTPIPGAIRTMVPAELQRLASKFSIPVTPPANGVCFEWPMAPLDPTQARETMRKALPEGARIEVVELSRSPVPSGTIEFPIETLRSGLWRGFVRYGSNGRYDVWARVRVSMRQLRVVAVSSIRAGAPIGAEQIRLEECVCAPETGVVTRIEDALGRISRTSIAAGQPLVARMLDAPFAVSRGDMVRLRARAGKAQVVVDALAQQRGRIGDVIPVKNANSGRILRAHVEAPGEAVLAQ